MPKLTYWYAAQDDHKAYDARFKTKRECLAHVNDPMYSHANWGPVKKVTVEYKDGFDLMMECSNEGSHWWEGRYDD